MILRVGQSVGKVFDCQVLETLLRLKHWAKYTNFGHVGIMKLQRHTIHSTLMSRKTIVSPSLKFCIWE